MSEKPKTRWGGMASALQRSSGLVTDYADGDGHAPVEAAASANVDTSAAMRLGTAHAAANADESTHGPSSLTLSTAPRGRAPRAVTDSVAKRRNRDLTQMSVFVNKKVHKRVKIRLAELEDKDLSDLVDMLLVRWLAENLA